VKKILLIVAGFVLAGAPTRGDETTPKHDDSFTKDGLFKADVNDLKDTELVVSPEMPLAPDKNVLWCGTLQLAWNEAENLVGEKMHFHPSSRAADLLNRGTFTSADLDPASYVAIADFERNHVESEIRAALEKTFRGAASPELIPPVPANPGPTDFVAYSYLFKNLQFATPFFADKMDFAGKHVREFGFGRGEDADKRREETRIDDYRSEDNFILELETKSTGDQLILAKMTPSATLAETIATVPGRVQADTPFPPGDEDYLALPMLNFDLRRDFHELVGLTCKPSPKAKIKGSLVISDVK
jgi:hypothetical protein